MHPGLLWGTECDRITTTIVREWLAQIIAGTKKIEYRRIKPYWTKRIAEKPVYSGLLDSLLPFFLCSFRIKLALTLFRLEFCLPPNAPLILMRGIFAAMSVIRISSF